MPGGTIGVVSKWNSPCRAVCSDSILFFLHVCMGLRVLFHCGINRHQFEIGNSLWILSMPAMKCFLHVCTAHSAAFFQ